MTKRPNPSDDFPPIQLKTHVNSKHVASKEDMQEVYRSTMARMMEGARHAFSSDKKLTNGHGTSATSDPFTGTCSEEKGKRKEEDCCRCCKAKVNGRRHTTCSYCQQPVCADTCVCECCVCTKTFCQFCAVLNYDKAETRAFCIDCLEHFSWN